MDEEIPAVNLKAQYDSIRQEIDAAMRAVLDRQGFILGQEVAELERLVAEKQQCAHAVGCASGSDALLLALLALGIGAGDSVIVPPFTFFATAGAVARAGARPIFVDIDPRTFNLSPKRVEDALRSANGASVKAIIPVHLYGQCADMDELIDLARPRNIAVVEDAAQAILAHYKGRASGSIGACGCFSFFPTKNLGGFGDGGMLTTNNEALAQRVRVLRVHGAVKKYVHEFVGLNSRLDTLQAAVLLAKIRHLEQWTELRGKKADFYRRAFSDTDLVRSECMYPTQEAPVVLPYLAPDRDHVYHQFTMRVERRDQLAQHLSSKGIETVVYYPVPLHVQQAFTSLVDFEAPACPESERAAKEVLSIPIFPEITEEQQARVIREIRTFYRS